MKEKRLSGNQKYTKKPQKQHLSSVLCDEDLTRLSVRKGEGRCCREADLTVSAVFREQ